MILIISSFYTIILLRPSGTSSILEEEFSLDSEVLQQPEFSLDSEVLQQPEFSLDSEVLQQPPQPIEARNYWVAFEKN